MPRCAVCGENDERILRTAEAHHIFGHSYSDAKVLLCPNCHAKVTADQNKLSPKQRSGNKNLQYCLYSAFSLIHRISEEGMKRSKELMQNAPKNSD